MRRSRKFSRGVVVVGGGGVYLWISRGPSFVHVQKTAVQKTPAPPPPPLDPRMADVLLKHFQSPVGLILNINVGSFKPCSHRHRRCNRLATVSRPRKVKIADRLQGCRKVLLKSVTSRRSVADQPPSMSNLNQSLAVF